jgi:hypothetical protein
MESYIKRWIDDSRIPVIGKSEEELVQIDTEKLKAIILVFKN